MRLKPWVTAGRVLKDRGLLQLAGISLEKAQMWWRHGEPFELGKYTGRPSPIVRLDGCRFGLDSSEVSENVKHLLLSGKHEKAERQLLKRYLDPDLPLVEFGGCIGVVSCLANKLLTHPTRHVVIEANPAMVPILTSNRERNGCRFTVLHRAVAYDESPVEFFINDNPLISSVQAAAERSVAVGGITLHQVVDGFGFEQCTLVCDIEGAEVELVRHEASTLAERVVMMIVEVHERFVGSEPTAAMLDALRRRGFGIVDQVSDTVVLRNERTSSSPAALRA